MSSTTNTHTHTHTSSKNAPTCGICGEVLKIDPSTGKMETFHAHALRQSTNMSLSEEVRAKELKNKQNLEAMKEKRDAVRRPSRRGTPRRQGGSGVRERWCCGESLSIAQAVLAVSRRRSRRFRLCPTWIRMRKRRKRRASSSRVSVARPMSLPSGGW